MRVLALVPAFYGPAGNAVNERELITMLAQSVEKCYIITFVSFGQIFTKRREELRVTIPENLAVICLPIPHKPILLTYLAWISGSCIIGILGLMLGLMKKIDLIYIRTSFLAIGILTFKSLAKKTVVKIPSIAEDEIPYEGPTKFFSGRIAYFLDRIALSRANKIAVNCLSIYHEIVRRRSIRHRDEPLIVPPGVNFNVIQKVKNQMCGNSSGKFVNVGYLGLLSWWQGVEILAHAVALVTEKMPNLRLVIIGDGEFRPFIEKTCKALNIAYEITGFLPHLEALRRLSMVDVLVLPNRRITTTETIIPMKVIEAWALGIPVIVTRRSVFLVNQITNFEEVLYCEPEPPDVARAIFTLLNDNDLREKLIVNGQKLAIRFDYNKIAENLLKLKGTPFNF